MEDIIAKSEFVPAAAFLIACYFGKTATLTKILEYFPYVLDDGAFKNASGFNIITQTDLSFLDTDTYKNEVLPYVSS